MSGSMRYSQTNIKPNQVRQMLKSKNFWRHQSIRFKLSPTSSKLKTSNRFDVTTPTVSRIVSTQK